MQMTKKIIPIIAAIGLAMAIPTMANAHPMGGHGFGGGFYHGGGFGGGWGHGFGGGWGHHWGHGPGWGHHWGYRGYGGGCWRFNGWRWVNICEDWD